MKNQSKEQKLDSRSKYLRAQVIKMLDAGGRGHLGSAFSMIEMLRVLYDDVLKYDASNPTWSERDRFIFSKGHGCLALYSLLADKEFFPAEEMQKFCHFDGMLGGHPEHSKIPGVEASTGSLGHGLSIAVGMALSAKRDRRNTRVFAMISDGECNEGSTWEAALCAGKHQLSNLTVLIDYNKMQSYSTTEEVLSLEPMADKWQAFNFEVREVNGHDVEALKTNLLEVPFSQSKPSIIICHTVKGKGISFAEGNAEWHHKSKIPSEQIEEMLTALEEY